MAERSTMIGLAEAAMRLRIPHQRAHRLLLTGALRGEKRGGRWWVRVEDVERLVRGEDAGSAGPSGTQ